MFAGTAVGTSGYSGRSLDCSGAKSAKERAKTSSVSSHFLPANANWYCWTESRTGPSLCLCSMSENSTFAVDRQRSQQPILAHRQAPNVTMAGFTSLPSAALLLASPPHFSSTSLRHSFGHLLSYFHLTFNQYALHPTTSYQKKLSLHKTSTDCF